MKADEAFAQDAIAVTRRSIARGDLLAAYDGAMSALAEGVADPALRYFAVLSLARMGDARHALDLYESLDLEHDESVDAAALKGRLLKDIARTAPEPENKALFVEARDAYLSAYHAHGGYFPAINAASTALFADDHEGAEALAHAVLEHPDIAGAQGYYASASALEANLLLGDVAAARDCADRALTAEDADAGSRATTCRQIALIGKARPELAGSIATIVAALRPAPVTVYTGHMFRADPAVEAAISQKINAVLDDLGATIAYGALACGADILIAEAILARGGELNVVLPFAEEDFLAQSVRPGGSGWEARFRTCMEAATSCIYATETGYVGDPEQFTYGTHVALGLTSIRARHILADAVQIAVLQPADQAGSAGTARDVELWSALGHRTIRIDPGPVDRALDHPPVPATAERAQHSILFADFAGFSQLGEAQLPLFLDAVMGRIAAVLDTHPGAILSRNTWGDALYAVIDSPQVAAEIALAQQEALRELPPLLSKGLTGAGMRIGVHHGPVYCGVDPVLGKPIYYGTEVTRTARIEPVTPTGEVYVTQAFAAMLALEAPDRFALEYVGRIKLAKGYGTLAMYRLSIVRG